MAIREFLAGLGSLPRAVGLLARSGRLRRLAAVPALLSVLLLGVLVALSLYYGGPLLERFWPAPEAAAGWRAWLGGGAHGLARWVLTGLLLLLSGAVFFFGSSVIAEPFVDFLSEGTEREVGVERASEGFAVGRWLRDTALVLIDVTVDLGLLLVLQALLLVLHFVPGLGQVLHLVLGWLTNAAFAGNSVASMPLCRRGLHGFRRWRLFGAHRARLLGLGVGVMLVLLVPLAQLLTLPLAVIAGTLVVVDLEREGSL